jgi:hypothetical protein
VAGGRIAETAGEEKHVVVEDKYRRAFWACGMARLDVLVATAVSDDYNFSRNLP